LDCEVIAIPAKYDFKPYAYGFQKDSPYLGLFNHYLKEMREKGQKWLDSDNEIAFDLVLI
jgi:hypothetical protein